MKAVSVEEAAGVLRNGGIVVHPTEEVYGIGGALQGPATEALRNAKGRRHGGFVVLLPEGATGLPLSAAAKELVAAYWPGPLTLVLDDPEGRFPDAVKADDGSIAVRRCGNLLANRLIDGLGAPITSTSANLPGGPPSRTLEGAMAAAKALGLDAVGIDGGTLEGGRPSTIVDVRALPVRVLREGAIGAEDIARTREPSVEEPWSP